MRHWIMAAICAALAAPLLTACGGNNTYNPALDGQIGATISISPRNGRVGVGGQLQLTATVTGTTNTTASWEVVGSNAGAIDSTGLYVARSAPGVYTVRARLVSDEQVSDSVQVTVEAGDLEGTIN